MPKRLNTRGIKKRHTYTLDEVADILSVHVQTVRGWGKAGLPVMRGQKPHLVAGEDLAKFLAERRIAAKRPLGPNEIYCLRCRRPVRPAGDYTEFRQTETGTSRLISICPHCDSLIHRYIRVESIREVAPELEITFANEEGSLNCDI